MSTDLVRQALQFVDEEDSQKVVRKPRGKGKSRQSMTLGQDYRHPYKNKIRKVKDQKSSERIVEENIRKLLELSKPTADANVTEKIVERAVKGRPVLEKIPIKIEKEKSILFPDEPEPFSEFEEKYFCS